MATVSTPTVQTFPATRAVLFDWGGTLAKPKQRMKFLLGTPGEQLEALQLDTLQILRTLKDRGIKVGVVSNTRHEPQFLRAAIQRCVPLNRVVDFVIQSSDINQCRKPCEGILREALRTAECTASEAAFIGNSLLNDIVPAHEMGMRVGWVRHNDLKTAVLQALHP